MTRLDRTIPILFTVSIALKSVMIVLESAEKRPILTPQFKAYPLEATSGVFSRSVFWWLSSLFLQGYRNVLSLGDLFPLDRGLYSDSLYERLQLAWTQSRYLRTPLEPIMKFNFQVVVDKKPDGTLFNTTLRVLKWSLLAAAFPRLCLVGFSFAQPFLINRAILFASSPDTRENRKVGYGLIGAYVLVYTGIAVSFGLSLTRKNLTDRWFKISNAQYEYRMYRAATIMRGSLIPCIYKKTLNLETSEVNPAAALTLVSTDIETIKDGIVFLHELWASPIEVAIAIYLLKRQMGAASGVPAGFAIGTVCLLLIIYLSDLCFLVAIASTIGVAVFMGKAQANWIQASQERVARTSATIGSIKWIKLSGLTDSAFSVIRSLRAHELEMSRRFRVLLMGVVALCKCPSYL